MKQITTILILFFALTLSAQEYTSEITSEPGDSTFQYEEITTLSDTRFEIRRVTGLDTASIQQIQYAKIARLYNRIAQLETEIYAAQREIASLKAGLAGAGLDDYNNNQITTLDSTYAATSAVFSTSTGIREICLVQAREGLPHVIRRQSDNAVVGTIVPQSPNHIRINLQPEFQANGVTSVFMFARDTRNFRGTDQGTNTIFRLRITR